ncbi:MAG TPA: hypothetical protein PK264_22710 [Hyphomicrobiaceae bacterium]|nr:hypothetical protein [Hyphomicrobiaceae bacterium]
MTATPKPTFAPLELDDIDARIEGEAARRGIPTLTLPDPADRAGQGVAIIEKAVKIDLQAPPSTRRPARTPAARRSRCEAPPGAADASDPVPTPRARMIPLNVEVPDYAWVEIKSRAARDFTSMRFLILKLLRDSGIRIDDADMIEDGRRVRERRE